jgi:hypothetical protein
MTITTLKNIALVTMVIDHISISLEQFWQSRYLLNNEAG